jgi:hypothetical protein
VTSNLVTGLQIDSCIALSHDLPNFNEYLLKDTDRFVMRLGVQVVDSVSRSFR